jgi:chemotaxis signal transduction protein
VSGEPSGLLVSVAGQRLLLDLRLVDRVLPMLAVEPAHGAPPALLGWADLGGRPVPILALRPLLGLPHPADDVDHRIVVCAHPEGAVGLVADEVLGPCAPSAERPATLEDRALAADVVRGVAIVPGGPALVLELRPALRWLAALSPDAAPAIGGGP